MSFRKFNFVLVAQNKTDIRHVSFNYLNSSGSNGRVSNKSKNTAKSQRQKWKVVQLQQAQRVSNNAEEENHITEELKIALYGGFREWR